MDDLATALMDRQAQVQPTQEAPKGLPKGFSLGLVGSNLFDAGSTQVALGRGAHELNPAIKPIANNPAMMYGVKGGLGALEAFLLNKLSKAGHPKLAKGLGIAGIAAPTIAGLHNLSLNRK